MATARKTSRKMQANERGGFTIIEVVLVLAIAGLIFLMVFIALPTLQRSQRDTQRRNDLARISTQISQYQTNNNGRLPAAGKLDPQDGNTALPECNNSSSTTSNAAACFVRNYMNSVNASENEFIDPDGWSYGLTIEILTNGTQGTANTFDHMVYIYEHAKCNGEVADYSSNARDYAIMYKLEGSGTYCQDNQ